ncbi:MAG TPA: lysylphosphatidylglycerol synthase transmembrane domain-containing protein [Trueperaceae bacterium]
MKILKYVLHAVILIGLVLAALRYLNSEEVLEALYSFDPFYGVLVLMVPAVQLALKSWRFEVFLRPFGVRHPSTVMRAYAAGQPATLVPGGIAARIGLLSQAHVPVSTSAAAVLFSSLFDQAVFVMGLFVTAIWFPAARVAALITLGAVALVALLLAVPQVRTRLGRPFIWLAKRVGLEEGVEKFGEAVRTDLSKRVVAGALALSVAAFATDVLLLEFSLRGLDLQVPLPEVFLAYLLPTMLGRLSALPAGGIGLAEAGIVGYLAGVSGVDPSVAVVAAAVFRVSTVFLQALYGAFVYWFAWKGDRESVLATPAEA